jgi:hypothetical protein
VSGFSEKARTYFRDRAIFPSAVALAGVREEDGALVFPYLAEDGTPFGRRRSLNGGPAKVMQPRGWPLAPWWPAGRPDTAPWVLVCEGESDALAAMSALRAAATSDVPYLRRAADTLGLGALPVVAVPGCGFPAAGLAEALSAVGCIEARLAFDADQAGQAYTDRAAVELVKAGVRPFRVCVRDGSDIAADAAHADDRGDWIANVLADADPLTGVALHLAKEAA